MKRKLIGLLPVLLIIPIMMLIAFKFSSDSPISNVVRNIPFLNEIKADTTEDYEIQEVKLFAVSLKVKGAYDENIKANPLTCRINVERLTKLIYMDGDEELGYKYVHYKKPAGELMQPTKIGYTFVQWTNRGGELVDENTIINSTVDYRIYANWNIIVSELTVDPNGGTWEDSTGTQEFSMEYSEEKEISDPTRVGYTFSHWQVKGDYSKIEDRVFTMGVEDSLLTAIWNANDYTLTIDPNKGKYGGTESVTKKTIKYDSTTYIENPTRTGYTFTGWTVSNGVLNGKNFFMNYTGDVTLTANWVINDYEYIVYHSQQSVDGSTYNRVANATITGSATFNTTVKPAVNTYTGFTSPAQQSMVIQEDTSPPVKNVIDYKYARKRLVLTVNPNGGTWNSTNASSTVNLYYQQTYQVANPTRTGYNFSSWTKSTSDSTLADRVFTMGLTNTTLTANWTAKTYTLTYNVNGGNSISPTSKTITFNQTYGTLPTPTRSGYKFLGWYTAASGGSQVTASTVHNVDSNVTIYAHWQNTPPTTPTFSFSYQNSGKTTEGLLGSYGYENITITVRSTDAEDGTPTITLQCVSGSLCSYSTISRISSGTGYATFTMRANKVGVAVLRATATDKPGLSSTSSEVVYVYNGDGGLSATASYTSTTFDSGWLDALEGCYISDYSFTVQFASGHNNSDTSDPDVMIVYGLQKSGAQVILYSWSGNMSSTIHSSTINSSYLNNSSNRIVSVRFYTYSWHTGCTPSAKITYSLKYTFDRSLVN